MMILQLKVTLKDSKPPIWRRIEVRDSITFAELHDVIQAAFDWLDFHLHGFDIRRSNGVRVKDYVTIGPIDTGDFGLIENDYDEEEVLLKDVLIKEKDRVLYTYDFGDDWEHDVVLEKVLPEETGVFYPRCTKALRAAPEEDSRLQYLETGIVTEEIDPKGLRDEINDLLREEFEEAEPSVLYDQRGKELQTWSRLLDLAEEYKQLKPWQWLGDDQIFAVEDPETKECVFCSVMGGAGMEFGLAAFIGEEGRQYLKGLSLPANLNESYYLKQRSLLLSFSNREELSPEDVQILKDHDRTYRGKNQWPLFRSFEPGYYPWFLDEEEVRLFARIIEQVIHVSALAKKDAKMIKTDLDHFFTWKYDEASKEWMGEYNSGMDHETNGKGTLMVNELELQEIKKSFKRSKLSLEFDCDYLSSPLQDHPNERPYYPIMILAVERVNGLIVYSDLIKMNNPTATIQIGLYQLLRQIETIPKEIRIKEQWAHALRPIARKLNINLVVVQALPFLEEARREMEMMLPQ